MKLNLIMALGLMGFAGATFANEVQVYCDVVSKKVDGEMVLGVKVINLEMEYEQVSWFGSNAGFQRIARDVCLEVLESAECRGMSGESYLYAELGIIRDLNETLGLLTSKEKFGAGLDLEKVNHHFFKREFDCNEARAELAHEMVRNVQKKYLQNPNQKILEEHPTDELNSPFSQKKKPFSVQPEIKD
ncbi:MAG: hypothetical protein KGP28_06795 [Bdellovibrionales bacterium]|nr:hypothetical protein [Bdellovibrionales bacterium]